MLAEVASAGFAALSEIERSLACIALCASKTSNVPGSGRKLRQWVWHPLARKSGVLKHRQRDLARFVNPSEEIFSGSSLLEEVITRCRMRDGFLEGADGEGAAYDCLASSEGVHSKGKNSVLWNLVQDIEPLDVNRVVQNVFPDSKDAMKRTVSGMLGLLPSDRFLVTVEVSREPLAKLLISSIMTGYTLRNAEYRFSLHRSLELGAADENSNVPPHGGDHVDEAAISDASQRPFENISLGLDVTPNGLPSLTPELENYISQLKSKLSSVTKELEDYKRKNAALDMDNITGEKRNALLNYLRSLDSEKVSELSQPSSQEVEETIRQVVCKCLQTVSVSEIPTTAMKVDFNILKGPHEGEGVNIGSSFTTNRDFLARLLFWCMLFGHHIRGLEYRLELSRTFSLCGNLDFTQGNGA